MQQWLAYPVNQKPRSISFTNYITTTLDFLMSYLKYIYFTVNFFDREANRMKYILWLNAVNTLPFMLSTLFVFFVS